MSYVLWALLAMVCYSFAFLFMKIALQELPAFTVMPIAVLTLAVGATTVAALYGDWSAQSLTSRFVPFALLAGLCLTGAMVGYFRALSTGPVSIVVPVFGMFLVGGALLGILVLWEAVTARKVATGPAVPVSSPSKLWAIRGIHCPNRNACF
ncbi:EamA family transporter [Haloarcula sp. GH36]|uniref:EamA family transporter n=1 Tax=Haloarcula montana TaxID=3111776 RepID=UPI002D79AC4D|nr:EamA family transporter [Haloarcula sp. GH36]